MVKAEGYARTIDDVGLGSPTSIELTSDGDDYVVQWSSNLSEYTPTGALLATVPISGQSFSIGGLKGPASGQFVLLRGTEQSGNQITLNSVGELNSELPASLNTAFGVSASNVIGLSNGGEAVAWFYSGFNLTLSLSGPGLDASVTLGTDDSGGSGGSTYPALAQLSNGSVVVGWTDDETSGVGAGFDDISLAIVSPAGTITNTQISGSTFLTNEPAMQR